MPRVLIIRIVDGCAFDDEVARHAFTEDSERIGAASQWQHDTIEALIAAYKRNHPDDTECDLFDPRAVRTWFDLI